MALELTTNFATSTVATAPSPATSGTTLVVQSGHGARFPAGAQDFNAVVCPADSQPTPANAEIVRVTNISTDTFTITRAQESTSARTIVVGDRIFAGVTAKTLADLDAATTFISAQLATKIDQGTLDAKGDLIGASAADTPARVIAPSNDQILVGDTAATPGVAWSSVLTDFLAAPELVTLSQGSIAAGTASGNQSFSQGNSTGGTGTSAVPLGLINIAAAEWAIAGYTTQLKSRIIVNTNGTAPTINFTVGLSAVTASGGGANAVTTTFSAQTAGTTATITTPALNTRNVATSSAFNLPSDGYYVLTCTMSGSMPATNPKVNVWLLLYKTYVPS